MSPACQDSSLAFQLQAEEQAQWRGTRGYRLTQGQGLMNIQHERGEAGSTSCLADITYSTIIKREARRHPEPTFLSTSHSTVQSTHRPSYLHRTNNAHFLAEATEGKTWIQSLKKPEPKQIKKHKASPHPLWRRATQEKWSQNWTSFLCLPVRHMTGRYSSGKLSLYSTRKVGSRGW